MTARVLFRIVELHLIGWLLPLAWTTATAVQPPRQEDAPLRQLEARLAEVHSEEAQLAEMTFRSGVGNLGWESAVHPHADFTEWAQIEFDQEYVIDQIVLVPILWRDTQGGVRSDGFPLHFKVFVGHGGDDIGTEVVSFDESDEVLPRMEPLVLPIQPLPGSWIRVEATRLTPRALDGGFLFQLSEIMAFSGFENVALGCETTVSSTAFTRVRKSAPIETLIDGFTPYLMDAAGGRGSQAFVGFFRTGPQAALTLDLGQQRQVNRIHLHAADLSENVPQIQHSDYAMPDQLVIEGANRSDFSDAVLLHEYEKQSIYDAGPIVMCRFAGHSCRFVRITAVRAYKAPEASDNYRCIGFAEIEIFENSENIARGIVPTANMEFIGKDGTLAALTDGRNHFGPIMPIRNWMTQLARRHELDSELPRIQAALKSRYATQSRNLRWASILVAVLFAAIVITVLVDRLIRIRETNRLKERFAADLHDEVGADLHTIGLLSDLARDVAMDRTKLDPILAEIRGVSEEASQSVRHISGIRDHSLYSGLVDLMKQSAERIGVQLEHEFHVEGNEFVEELRPRTRADLFLFYKECLVNVIRHSGATCLSTVLKASPSEVRLTIQDNGHGCDDAGDSGTPPSLKRRAKLLGAKVNVESCPQNGTRIDLHFKRRQWNQLKKR